MHHTEAMGCERSCHCRATRQCLTHHAHTHSAQELDSRAVAALVVLSRDIVAGLALGMHAFLSTPKVADGRHETLDDHVKKLENLAYHVADLDLFCRLGDKRLMHQLSVLSVEAALGNALTWLSHVGVLSKIVEKAALPDACPALPDLCKLSLVWDELYRACDEPVPLVFPELRAVFERAVSPILRSSLSCQLTQPLTLLQAAYKAASDAVVSWKLGCAAEDGSTQSPLRNISFATLVP
jgi:hypothetical protein